MARVDLENRILDTLTAPGAGRVPATAPAAGPAAGSPSFGQVLAEAQFTTQAAQANVKFSGHAQARLASRRIALSESDITKLGDALTRAAAKGARESLVLTDRAALVVSVPNRTVITAVDRDALKENIFTNIDSAMIL